LLIRVLAALAPAAVYSLMPATEARGEIIVPNAFAGMPGNAANPGPFFDNSVRYQQVYAASQFPGPLVITEISFRPAASDNQATFPLRFDTVRIGLSTTQKTPGTLSPTFAENVGPDNRTVFDGPVFVDAPVVFLPTGQTDFTINFLLTSGFPYDPRAGNLLLDVTAQTSRLIAAPFDAVLDDPTTAHVDAPSATATTGTIFPVGLVTEFGQELPTTMPEPPTLALLCLGILGLAGHGWWRRKQAGSQT
jgi:hypothetical protein